MTDLNEIEKVTFIKTLLTEKVQMVIDRDQTLTTVESMRDKLKSTYSTQIDWHRKLINAQQESNESVTEFLARIRVMVNKTDNNRTQMSKDEMDFKTLNIFWYKSKPEIEAQLTLLHPVSIEKAFAHALVVEENINKRKAEQDIENNKKKLRTPQIAHINETENNEESDLKEPYKNDYKNSLKQINERISAINKKIETNEKLVKQQEKQQIENKLEKEPVAGEPTVRYLTQSITDALRANLNFMASNTNTHRNNRNFSQRPGKPNYRQNYANNKHEQRDTRSQFTCYICKKTGHGYLQCYNATDEEKSNKLANSLNSNPATSSSPRS